MVLVAVLAYGRHRTGRLLQASEPCLYIVPAATAGFSWVLTAAYPWARPADGGKAAKKRARAGAAAANKVKRESKQVGRHLTIAAGGCMLIRDGIPQNCCRTCGNEAAKPSMLILTLAAMDVLHYTLLPVPLCRCQT